MENTMITVSLFITVWAITVGVQGGFLAYGH